MEEEVGPSDDVFWKYTGLRTSLQWENWHYGPAFEKKKKACSCFHLSPYASQHIMYFISSDSKFKTLCIAVCYSFVENLVLVLAW